jgi:hypothetical protein
VLSANDLQRNVACHSLSVRVHEVINDWRQVRRGQRNPYGLSARHQRSHLGVESGTILWSENGARIRVEEQTTGWQCRQSFPYHKRLPNPVPSSAIIL